MNEKENTLTKKEVRDCFFKGLSAFIIVYFICVLSSTLDASCFYYSATAGAIVFIGFICGFWKEEEKEGEKESASS